MSKKFAITIECNSDGKLIYWTQKGQLSPEELRRFEALKKRVEQICNQPIQTKLIA